MKMKSLLLIAIAALACAVSSLAQNVPSYVPTDGLVGWWPFNGNANDESGNGNDGNVNGATLTTDRFGNSDRAYNFNGTNNFISATNNNSLQTPDAISINFWVQFYGPGMGRLVSKGWSPNGIEVHTETSTNHKIRYGGTFNGAGYGPISQTTLIDNQWYMVTTIDNGNIKYVYINGLLEDSLVHNYGSVPVSSVDLCFGKNSQNATDYLFGNLDDIAIWNRALNSQEITAFYTASSTNSNEASNTTANVPGAISYQAVARDAQGAPLADTNVQVRFTLIADSLSGVEEYVETHTLSTNSLGLFTTAFGAGTPVSSTFGNINWSAGHKFLNVKIDTGNGLVDMGTQQLLSTPYSLYSAKAGEIKNPGLPVFSDNAAALAGGLVAGDMYRTSAGDLKIVF
jgi:hypothetical protein